MPETLRLPRQRHGRLRQLVLAALACVTAAALMAPAARATFPGRDGLLAIAYSAPGSNDTGGETGIALVDAAKGKVSRTLLQCQGGGPPCPGVPLSVSASADGKRLAITDLVASADRLATLGADGTGLSVLSGPFAENDEPAFAPSGRLVFAGADRRLGIPELFTIATDGTGVRQLTYGGGHAPAVSPNGRWVAFQHDGVVGYDESTADRSSEIDLVSVDGKHSRHVVSDAAEPSWSPNGKQLVFVRGGRGGGIYVIDVTGRHLRRLLASPPDHQVFSTPVWAPDGHSIAAAEGPFNSDVITVATNGKHKRVVFVTPSAGGGTVARVNGISWLSR